MPKLLLMGGTKLEDLTDWFPMATLVILLVLQCERTGLSI